MNDIESYQVAVGEANQHHATAIDPLGYKFEQPLLTAGVHISELYMELIELSQYCDYSMPICITMDQHSYLS